MLKVSNTCADANSAYSEVAVLAENKLGFDALKGKRCDGSNSLLIENAKPCCDGERIEEEGGTGGFVPVSFVISLINYLIPKARFLQG